MDNYRNGKSEAPWSYFNSSGRLILAGNYIENLYQGVWTTFYPNGNVAGRIQYVNGEETGTVWVYDEKSQLQRKIRLEK